MFLIPTLVLKKIKLFLTSGVFYLRTSMFIFSIDVYFFIQYELIIYAIFQ